MKQKYFRASFNCLLWSKNKFLNKSKLLYYSISGHSRIKHVQKTESYKSILHKFFVTDDGEKN
jgi:hypothetical protein